MVKHQRRSHQRGVNGTVEFDGSDSDSDSGESPTTPKSSSMVWPVHGVPLAPVIGHGPVFNTYNLPQQQYPQHHGQQQVMDHPPHPGVQMLHRSASMPTGPFYVTEQNNPGVATMNTNPMSGNFHQIPRQQVERPQLDIPPFTAGGMNGSIQSSPSSFSAASGRSPSAGEGFYTHQSSQQATYTLQNGSQVDPQQQIMVQHQQPIGQGPPTPQPQMQQQQMMSQQQAQMMVKSSASPPPAPIQQSAQYQPAPHPQDQEHWYSGSQYHSPIDISGAQLPLSGPYVGMGTGMYHDAWTAAKMGYEDTPMGQLPSTRLETM